MAVFVDAVSGMDAESKLSRTADRRLLRGDSVSYLNILQP